MRLDSWRRTTHEMDVRPKLNINIEVNTSLYFSGVFSKLNINIDAIHHYIFQACFLCSPSSSSPTFVAHPALRPQLTAPVWQGCALTFITVLLRHMSDKVHSFIHSFVIFIILMIIHSSECSTNGGSSDGNCAAGFGNSTCSKFAIWYHTESPHPTVLESFPSKLSMSANIIYLWNTTPTYHQVCVVSSPQAPVLPRCLQTPPTSGIQGDLRFHQYPMISSRMW